MAEIYQKKPFSFFQGIPVFSKRNKYIENYEKISLDHLAELQKTGKNPFIPEDLWCELENSTKEMILKYARKGKILDVGVGIGRLLSLLPTSFDKYGMDISKYYLTIAKKKGIKVALALIDDIPYKENFFDVIVCTDVLEHVFDLNSSLKKILFCLKKGGLLVIRVPYKENLSGYLEKTYPYKYVHIRNFDEHSLQLLFQKVFNLRVLEYQLTGTIIHKDVLEYRFSEHFRRRMHLLFNPFGLQKILDWVDQTRPKITKNIEINVAIKKNGQ